MDVYDSVSTLYYCSFIFGLTPYKFNNNKSNRKYVPSSYIKFHSSFLCCFLVFHYILIAKDFYFLGVKLNTIAVVTDTVHISGTTIVITILFASNYAKRRNIIQALNKIHIADQKFMEFGYTVPHKVTKICVTLSLLSAAVILAVVEHLNCHLFVSSYEYSYPFFCNSLCLLTLFVITLEELQIFTYFFLLRQRFRILNSLLTTTDKIANEKINSTTILNCDKRSIVKLRSLHLQLCFAGKLLNEYFSIQILLLIGFSFVGFTTNAYYSFDVIFDNLINNGSFDEMPSTIIWMFAKFTELLLISVIGTITKNEANYTGEALYQLKNRFEKLVAVQINLFAKQILHSDFKITASDFFDVDMTLFYGIIGSAATYLTVLIQFEIAVKSKGSQ